MDLGWLKHWKGPRIRQMPSNASKPSHLRRSASFRLRLLDEQKEVIARAADQAGVSLSDWARAVLVREAQEELAEE